LRERLGNEARQYAAEWSAEVMARRLVEFYRQVIASRCHGRDMIVRTDYKEPVS
jgi:hypothetical protein